MQYRIGAGGSSRIACTCAALVAGALGAVPAQARGAVAHVVQPGETLWSISAANNLTTRTVAAFNGLPEDAMVVQGQTVNVPTVEEGAAALAATPAAAEPELMATGGGRVVQPGESLWSVATANGLSVEGLAAANGISPDAYLTAGATITVPSGGEAAVAQSNTAGMGHVPSPHGDLHLDPAAAGSWNAMRSDALANHGVDLYPAGPASAYRTAEQQQELYDLYLSGQGAPANPPGTSTHEVGTAVDVAEPVMRDVIDRIGGAYGWSGTIPSEWWHVAFSGW